MSCMEHSMETIEQLERDSTGNGKSWGLLMSEKSVELGVLLIGGSAELGVLLSGRSAELGVLLSGV